MQYNGRMRRGVDLKACTQSNGIDMQSMPYVMRIILENQLRSQLFGKPITHQEILQTLQWQDHVGSDLSLFVTRVILPDSSGIPVLQDLAALRNAVAREGGNPSSVDTCIPVDLVVDHSLQVDAWGTPDAMKMNMRHEFDRNAERYAFLGWAQQAFSGLNVFPPGSGIIHQVNLERIATVVASSTHNNHEWMFPEFIIGGDSHTPMINALGVLGWGVGGIEAEAALLGHAYTFALPQIVGVKLIGDAAPLVWTTDIALLITERLRKENVTNCAVEFFGNAASAMTIPERATIANMSPEYGATCGYFPVDEQTLEYMRITGRHESQIKWVSIYCKQAGLFKNETDARPLYARVIEIDISKCTPSMAGPSRPQDRLPLQQVSSDFHLRLSRPVSDGGFSANSIASPKELLPQGAVVIAAIASCTNTSNPQVMIAAGLVAQNAVRRRLKPPPWVKTSLAPGSPNVIEYLQKLNLLTALEQLGFHLIGFGCTTCGGKSGPLAPEIVKEIEERHLVTAAVLSGNRNFSGRIHKMVKANYIGAPPLVVAYALAGRIDIRFDSEPIGIDEKNNPVYLHELLPTKAQVNELIQQLSILDGFKPSAASTSYVDSNWLQSQSTGTLYPWDPISQYLREPPFFNRDLSSNDGITQLAQTLQSTRVLAAFGDSLTTDHISPSGEIPTDTPAGQYLIACGIIQRDFNSFVGRRGNFEVMVRGTFANIRLRNLLTPNQEGGWTKRFPDQQRMTIYDASCSYLNQGTSMIVLGGKDYGIGSSRDWAAKGTAMLGVKAVLAESFERIHRANLIGMGVLPLRFEEGMGWQMLGLDGSEIFTFKNIENGILNGSAIEVHANHSTKKPLFFLVYAQAKTHAERQLLAAGGIPQSVFHKILNDQLK